MVRFLAGPQPVFKTLPISNLFIGAFRTFLGVKCTGFRTRLGLAAQEK